MKHGADWYKREPLAYLGGVQGMKAAHHAVYGVVVDLCYVHGGAVNNDPKWIAGWIGDMGSAAVRKAIADLIEMGKLFVDDDGNLSQKRAKNEAKTRENLRENAAENGRKGGKKSAENRSASKEINALDQATASSENQADKIREDKRREEKKKEPPLSPKRGKQKAQIDPSSEISADQLAIAIERGLPEAEAKAQFCRFRDWAVAKGQAYADWNAAWRNWITSPHYRPVLKHPEQSGGGYWTSMGYIAEAAH